MTVTFLYMLRDSQCVGDHIHCRNYRYISGLYRTIVQYIRCNFFVHATGLSVSLNCVREYSLRD